MLAFRILRKFSEMKYYKEIALFLKIKVPVLNEEINITEHTNCLVHGIKKIEPDIPIPAANQQEPIVVQSEGSKQSSDIVPQPLYIYQKHSQQIVPFQKALSISKTLQMDLNLMRQGSEAIYPILTVTNFRKHVYSEYFMNYIKRRGKDGFKGVRLGQKIEDNDLRNKIENIQRMVKNGERRFKLMANNDSDRSEKVLIEFAKLFGKEVEPYLQKVRNNIKRKQEERWAANLTFDDQVAVNIDQVNNKWRRRQFEQAQAKKERTAQQLQSLFYDTDIRMQRQVYNAFKDLNVKMPLKFEQMARDERSLQTDKMSFYRSVQSDPEQEWDESEQNSFRQKSEKYNKQFFGQRSAREILSEMQDLKRSGYESEAHKVARFKELKQQLLSIVKKHKNQDL